MTKLPVYRTCKVCGGTGTIYVDQYLVNPTYTGTYGHYETCKECHGNGKLETDLFIEYSGQMIDLFE